MILLCEHPALCGMRERPINTCGLACADQGQPRAALDANDLWIRFLRAQHPVESYRQLARRRHLGHRFRLLVTAMQILAAKFRIITYCCLGRFHLQHAHHAIALLGNCTQLLLSAGRVLAESGPGSWPPACRAKIFHEEKGTKPSAALRVS